MKQNRYKQKTHKHFFMQITPRSGDSNEGGNPCRLSRAGLLFLFGPMFAPIPMRGCIPIPVVTCAFLHWFLPQFLGQSNRVFNLDVYGHP